MEARRTERNLEYNSFRFRTSFLRLRLMQTTKWRRQPGTIRTSICQFAISNWRSASVGLTFSRSPDFSGLAPREGVRDGGCEAERDGGVA